MGIRDIARQVAGAQAQGGRGNFLRDGKGVLIVKKLSVKKTRKGNKFIAEHIVDSSENLPDALDNNKQQVLANAPGTSATYLESLDGEFAESAFSRVKEYVLQLLGETETSVRAEAEKKAKKGQKNPDGKPWNEEDEFVAALELILSDQQPMRGARIKYCTYRKDTKKGATITVPEWAAYPNDGELIKKTRKELDGRPDAGVSEADDI